MRLPFGMELLQRVPAFQLDPHRHGLGVGHLLRREGLKMQFQVRPHNASIGGFGRVGMIGEYRLKPKPLPEGERPRQVCRRADRGNGLEHVSRLNPGCKPAA